MSRRDIGTDDPRVKVRPGQRARRGCEGAWRLLVFVLAPSVIALVAGRTTARCCL